MNRSFFLAFAACRTRSSPWGTLSRLGVRRTVAPGRINTAQIRKLHPTEQSRADYIKQNIPAGYFGEPYDIGHLVAFLASPLARYINGAAIPVDGGAVRRSL